jgi:signal transduction histidine kinase
LVNLCELVQRQRKIKVDCFVSQRNTRLEPTAELGLYRITQELLNNALKYAEAKTIAVQLIRHETTVVLMVEDDGVGFDTSDLKKNMQGIGFKNVMARVESLGGSFSLESAEGEGVLASIEIPLRLAVRSKQVL